MLALLSRCAHFIAAGGARGRRRRIIGSATRAATPTSPRRPAVNHDRTPSAASAAIPLADLRRIDDLCARYEAIAAGGGYPVIEEFLKLAPDGLQDRLRSELLKSEAELRAARATVSLASEE